MLLALSALNKDFFMSVSTVESSAKPAQSFSIDSFPSLKWQKAFKQWDVGTMVEMLQGPDFLARLIQDHPQEVRQILWVALRNPDQVKLIQIIGSHPDYAGAKKKEITGGFEFKPKADLESIIDARDIENLDADRLNNVVFRCTWDPVYVSIIEEVIQKRLDDLTPESLTRIAICCKGKIQWESLKLLLSRPLEEVCLIDMASVAYQSNHVADAQELLGRVLAGPRLQCHLLDPVPRAIFKGMRDSVSPQNQARYLLFAAQRPDWNTLTALFKLGVAQHSSADQLGLILLLAVRSANQSYDPESYLNDDFVELSQFQVIVEAIFSTEQKISPTYSKLILREARKRFPETFEDTVAKLNTCLVQLQKEEDVPLLEPVSKAIFHAQGFWWSELTALFKLGAAKHASADQLGLILFLAIRSANHSCVPKSYRFENFVELWEFQAIVEAIFSTPQKISPTYSEMILREAEGGFPEIFKDTVAKLKARLAPLGNGEEILLGNIGASSWQSFSGMFNPKTH